MKIYNSYQKKIENFVPIRRGQVKMYTCGPTVWSEVQLGNIRTILHSDIVARTFRFLGYEVENVMNITDLDDKIERAAISQNKSAGDISQKYTENFLKTLGLLNILLPKKITKATDYIKDQVFLIRVLEEKGFVYQTSDGLYFDTSRFSDYHKYVNQTGDTAVSRIGVSEEKLSKNDFALWKFLLPDEKRDLVYDSPWGRGYPGWHIECSAMVLRELGDTIDLHLGGEDLKMTHHPNEIAQSESVTGAKFVNYWMHVAFLNLKNEKMSKSLGNIVTISDLEEKDYNLISLRYYFLTSHYRSSLEFSYEGLDGAQKALNRLYNFASSVTLKEDTEFLTGFLEEFASKLSEDFSLPASLGVMWGMLASDHSEQEKLATLIRMDEVLGLRIIDYVGFQIPKEILELAKTRWVYKKQGIFDKADFLRREIESLGYEILDGKEEFKVKKKIENK